jgi:hypothetical protein
MGNHWQIVRSAISTARQRNIELSAWVLSAGYGLIPIDAALHSYAASFSAGPDKVTELNDAPAWWTELAEWQGPAPTKPRTLTALVERTKEGQTLIAASAPYVRAIRSDLVDGIEHSSPKNVAVISAGFKGDEALNSILLDCDDRFLDKTNGQGGTAHTLNAKLAAWALDSYTDWEHDFAVLHRIFRDRRSQLTARGRPQRRQCTDKEILSFIEKSVATSPVKARSILLHELRDSGSACEQSRFKKLYDIVTAGVAQ